MGQATWSASKDPIQLGGTNRLLIGNVTLSASYATGGDTAPSFGVGLAPGEGNVQLGSSSGGYVLEWDGTNAKIKAYRDNGTATAAPLPEVAATTNLSAVAVEAWVVVST